MTNELPPHVKLGIEKEQWDMQQQAANYSQNIGASLTDVKIVRIDIPFMDLVLLLVKLAIAAIPAAIVVTVFWTIIAGFLGGILSNI